MSNLQVSFEHGASVGVVSNQNMMSLKSSKLTYLLFNSHYYNMW